MQKWVELKPKSTLHLLLQHLDLVHQFILLDLELAEHLAAQVLVISSSFILTSYFSFV